MVQPETGTGSTNCQLRVLEKGEENKKIQERNTHDEEFEN